MEPIDHGKASVPGVRKTVGGRRSALRIVQRQNVGLIAIYEQEATKDESHERVLVIENGASTLRLTKFPDDWHRLSDDQLLALAD